MLVASKKNETKSKLMRLLFKISCLKMIILLGIAVIILNGCLSTNKISKSHNHSYWKIKNGEIQLNENSNNVSGEFYWTFFNNLVSSKLVNEYLIGLKLQSDGLDGDLAGITPVNDLNTKWEIEIDTLDFKITNNDSLGTVELTHTLIHEFGHLLTLNPEQVIITNDKYQDDKHGYLTQEGYAKPISYLGLFIQEFWKDKILEEWDGIQSVKLPNRKDKLLYDFYLANKKDFVSDYAAESPEEDIAESWTFFILSEKPLNQIGKYSKVNFFYQFPELVSIRMEIRNQLTFNYKNYIEKYKNASY